MLRVLIADDEAPARDKLLRQLGLCENVTVVAVATDGEEALAHIHQHLPNIALLDINMPKLNGLEVVERIQTPCCLIFTTAYDEYAVKAFEAAALDYLLKPYSQARLQQALNRAQQQIALLTNKINESPIASKIGHKTRLHPLDSIYLFKSSPEGILSIGENFSSPVEKTLDELSQTLPPHFVRVHRSCIANTQKIAELKRIDNGKFQVFFNQLSVTVTTSRAGAQLLKNAIK